jgi:hypothetical protein
MLPLFSLWRSASGRGSVKTQTRRDVREARPFKTLLRRFLEVGNGKETPKNDVVSRFYTAWADSRH